MKKINYYSLSRFFYILYMTDITLPDWFFGMCYDYLLETYVVPHKDRTNR